MIAEALKRAKLPAEFIEKAESFIYNVDSFQGHEKPYVIVSAVRTTAPGFLRSLNRMNVMLTRTQAGMVLVTQRAFLRGPGKSTLLSRLAYQWERRVGEKATWVDAMEVANGRVTLPGSQVKQATQPEAKQQQQQPVRSRRVNLNSKGGATVTQSMRGLKIAG